ncbi:MAG: UDP-N-acetylmuramoyl-tripeptide--D-alanyl-D-alanine ligase [Deltaproteobacteria bacterium CG_4_10_14_0_2_um_filter_43_8]|nr:MAG: UDP-N-acetylmuramoylalanyl-D-glutamyl-2, 6-diaminopimelate--D-alanyl-D-alanine ligase [Deltaproteobacteria bacterium CG11_big_fil_rev_8_21_14_0_20_42_23]PJA18359.1 MAG: UDP-N-acetylmuramoyl-tripeptide--D-alanyl-D-alanine ligase [Deltaproteobacteria bacterium CG_4_10_14_0_2_um_filter_43_8]PJC65102.1 MAG: UDP-N-acetylmuramoyl-tripeptide--D-alanyl-D-alanine ligase [Deltaproteobacteria bacterium CG_4_9_14_0_2_um_filter_42_21]
MNLSVEKICAATAAKSSADLHAVVNGVNTDSRLPQKGQLFVALKGPHFDGHHYCKLALEKGAVACVVQEEIPSIEKRFQIVVSDTLAALGDLAAYWRSLHALPVVAITGSNGKSTTKEMVASVLSSLGAVHKTEGNFNNLIGLPLTLFKLEASHKALVLELGMNAPGEIKRLTEISKPDFGLITNVTAAHLHYLGSIDAVAKAKGELFETIASDKTIIVNRDDPRIMQLSKAFAGKKISFGLHHDADVSFAHAHTFALDSTDLTANVFGKEMTFHLPFVGAHNIMNALAALACGSALGLSVEEMAKNFSSCQPMKMRFERVQLRNGARLINDAYNANPESVRAALRTISAADRTGRFAVVLGEMLELGTEASDLHRQIGFEAAKYHVDLLYLYGDHAQDVARGAIDGGLDEKKVRVFTSLDDLSEQAHGEIAAGDVWLVKGSRGMQMEKMVTYIKRAVGTD